VRRRPRSPARVPAGPPEPGAEPGSLEETASAPGIIREVTGATLHPETLLAGLGEMVCAWGLKLLLVDASQADPDEVEALAPLSRDFSTEWLVHTVVFLPSEEAGDG
jgi:hypothetical protein